MGRKLGWSKKDEEDLATKQTGSIGRILTQAKVNEGTTNCMIISTSKADTEWEPDLIAGGRKFDLLNKYTRSSAYQLILA